MPQLFAYSYLELLQAISIIAGLLFTAVTIIRNTKARKASNLIALNNSQRHVWSNILKSGHEKRILSREADIKNKSVTPEEKVLIVSAILHLYTVFQVEKLGQLSDVDGMEKDIQHFFQNPLVAEVWQKNKEFQNRDFVKYVEGLRTR